jgi:2-(1,2-epoxy-1,2-dihydrophenyl)acetyl-CoA isomerase
MSSDIAPTVNLVVEGGVARLALARPAAANTMNLQFGRDFLSAISAIESAEARAVIVAGEGRNFCFGGDLNAMASSGIGVQDYLRELTTLVHAGLLRLTRLNAPVLTAVKGSVAGAGLGLVLASDIAIASRGAKFTTAYTGVGLTPDAGCSFLLGRAVGHKRAMELFLTNRILSAEEALSWGLVNQVVDEDKLDETVTALAARLAAGPSLAFGALKRLVAEAEQGFESQLERESIAMSLQGCSAEGQEGISAFLAKRAAEFRRSPT